MGTGQNVDHPYQISKYEDYVGRPFNDLWDYIEKITAPAGTLSRFLEPQFVDINAKIDGRKRVTFPYPYSEWWSGIFQIIEINLLFIF